MTNRPHNTDDADVNACGLPEELRPLFWDHDFDALSLDAYESFVISRVLSRGSWRAVAWLRAQLGDESLRNWIIGRDGRGLDAKQLRFWELILGLPAELVEQWLDAPELNLWINRDRSRR